MGSTLMQYNAIVLTLYTPIEFACTPLSSMRVGHIEIANSLAADLFINALRRFSARRGKSDHIYGDNGSNFVEANRILRETLDELNKRSLNQFCCQQAIKETFNPPTASHMGGA